MNKNASIINSFKKYFKFDSYNAILKKEIIGGISTFIAMVYILAVNPSMVSGSIIDPSLPLDTPNNTAKMFEGGLFLSTAISSFAATMFMGLYAKIPISLAPGMGLNAFFTYTVASQVGFNSALTITIISGILYFLVVMTPAREKISEIMPTNLKLSIGAGIGFFVAYIGLQDSKMIVADQSGLVSKLGNFSHPLVIIALVLMIIGFILHYSKVPGAIIITMLLGGIILIPMIATGYIEGVSADIINPSKIGYKGFETFKDVAAAGWKGFASVEMWKNPITYIGALSFLYMDFFDTTGTLISIDKTLNISEKDQKWLMKANLVDATGTIAGASIGSTTVTAFVESNVGISAGARTGFSAIITSLCFGLSIALWPIIQVFMPIDNHKPITGPILVLVGTMMITQIKHFEWEIAIDIPVLFITIVFMMLSNSIAYGIAFATILFVFLNGSLGLFQQWFKKDKKIVNSMEITTTSHSGPKIKTREFYYLKRLNISLIIICLISIAYIIIQTGISYLGWFK